MALVHGVPAVVRAIEACNHEEITVERVRALAELVPDPDRYEPEPKL